MIILFIETGQESPIFICRVNKMELIKNKVQLLQKAHYLPLNVLAVVESNKYTLREICRIFRHLRIKGQWFTRDLELIEFIEELKSNPNFIYRKDFYYTIHWPKEKIEVLKNEYPRSSKRLLERQLGKTWDQIKKKANRLGIKRLVR